MNITAINFSGRRNGNCHDVAKFIEQRLMQNHKVVVLEMCNLDITPCGKCDYECLYYGQVCQQLDDDVFNVYMQLCSSDLIYL